MSTLATSKKYLDGLKVLEESPHASAFIRNMWKNKEVYIGGVIDYHSRVSNAIKFFTQSIYSHTNFFDPDQGVSFGSENLIGVVSVDYRTEKQGIFYYVVKKLDLAYLSSIFSFDTILDVYHKLGKSDGSTDMLKRYFLAYSYIVDTFGSPALEEALSFDLGAIEVPGEFLESFVQDEKKHLKEFILLGLIKFMIRTYKTPYNLSGAILTSTTPWDTLDPRGSSVFCSEFIADALLYAGLYPYDLSTKDPRGITPGDILDSDTFFEKNYRKIYHIDETCAPNHMTEITGEIHGELLKNYIIKREEKNRYFRVQRSLVNFFNRLVLLITR